MRGLVIFSLAFAMLATAGCAKSNSTNIGGPRASLAAGGGASGLTLNGTVGTSSTYQSQFQTAVTGLLSTDVNPSYVGTVSATPSQGSGVFFGGQVTLSSGSVRNASSSSTVTGGRLAIQVYDSTGGQVAAIPEILISNATGYVQGTAASIQFYDNYGSVTLQGTINTSTSVFSGTMSYDNSVLYDGTTPGAAGTIGTFSVPMCQFFSC